MSNSKIQRKPYISFFLILGGLILMTGCATLYQASYDPQKSPQMGFSQARQTLQQELQAGLFNLQIGFYNQPTRNVLFTDDGFILTLADGSRHPVNFGQIQGLAVTDAGFGWYIVYLNSNYLAWKTANDAKSFVDAFEAMKYYSSKHILVDDDAAAFADFQEKARIWQAASPKPPLPEEARRFRVLADDAVQNKEFEKAANYYEQGLAIDPVWPAGQFNAAMIYKELNFYTMAVMHMKRYLELKPGDVNTYRDQMYIWEEKASEGDSSSGTTAVDTQSAPSRGAF